jgi:hypothetical protein
VVCLSSRDNVISALDRRDHPEVVFQLDESDQCAAHHGDILGEQDLQREQRVLLAPAG